MTTLDQALAYMSGTPQDNQTNTYRLMCEIIAAHRDQLTYRVFIHLPGGMNSNNDPSWAAVKAASTELCGCGNERMIEPTTMRSEFVPSETTPVTMGLGDTVYIRPVGAPVNAAYTKFHIVKLDDVVVWTILDNPMFMAFDIMSLLSGPCGYTLPDLDKVIARKSDHLVVLKNDGKIPLIGLTGVDLDASTVTFLLDAAVEVFDPDTEPTHAH